MDKATRKSGFYFLSRVSICFSCDKINLPNVNSMCKSCVKHLYMFCVSYVYLRNLCATIEQQTYNILATFKQLLSNGKTTRL